LPASGGPNRTCLGALRLVPLLFGRLLFGDLLSDRQPFLFELAPKRSCSGRDGLRRFLAALFRLVAVDLRRIDRHHPSVELKALHSMQRTRRLRTCPSSACMSTVPHPPHAKSAVCELALRIGGALTTCWSPGVATNFNAIRGWSWLLIVLSRRLKITSRPKRQSTYDFSRGRRFSRSSCIRSRAARCTSLYSCIAEGASAF
jgi:hypothetical protein